MNNALNQMMLENLKVINPYIDKSLRDHSYLETYKGVIISCIKTNKSIQNPILI